MIYWYTWLIEHEDPDLLEPVIAGLFCQGFATGVLWPLYTRRVDEVDFDVYRRDPRDVMPVPSAETSSP